MKNDKQSLWQELSAGQLWRLKSRYVLIVALESLNVRFKIMNTDHDLEATTLSGDVDTLGRYLFSRHGRLVGEAQA